MRMKFYLFILLLVSITTGFAYRPIYFNRAATLEQKTLTMRIYYLETFFDSMYDKSSDQMIGIPDNTNLNFDTVNVFLSYGLMHRITVGLSSIYVSKEIENPVITKYAAGLGDLSNLIKISIIKNKSFYFSTALFVKWNNGKYEDLEKDELPLGTGTIDISIKPLVDFKFSKIWMYIIPTYTFSGKNDDIDKGDSVSLIVTSSFPVSGIKHLFGELSFSGFYKFEDKNLQGDIMQNSETYVLSISPAIQYSITKKLFLQILGEFVLDTKDVYGKSVILKSGISYKF